MEKSFKYFFISLLVFFLISISLIIWGYSLELEREELLLEYNVSDGETLIKCPDGSYDKVNNKTLMYCNDIINDNYVIEP